MKRGKTWNAPGNEGRWKEFRVYRWLPDEGGNPRMDTYWVRLDRCGPMVLDALHQIKYEIDSTLAFRRSCREGICGSCSMNIGGENALACLKPIGDARGAVHVYPLPHMPVIRDLVPDLARFFAHYHAVEPWLQAPETGPAQERRQSPAQRERLDGLYECILCACCSAACPSYWWNAETFPGPAALIQAHRWVEDSRDNARAARVARAAEPMGMFGCRQILNCTKVCPKGLNPAKAIAELRQLRLGFRR
jgi:succinate dehydrogenase / fumarate reductase iron-sulfur subunit